MPSEREVAGLLCSEIMDRLPDYVEGELTPAEQARVEAHLQGCTWCERFGGSYAHTVAALREVLGPPDPVADGVAGRLAARLDAAWGGPAGEGEGDG